MAKPKVQSKKTTIARNDEARLVGVRFNQSGPYANSYGGSTIYTFFTDLDLVKGDKVVVDTQYGLSVATVEGTSRSVTDATKATKWVVQKIDMEDFEKRKERQEEIRRLKYALERRRKAIIEEQTLLLDPALLKDPEYKRMADELRKIL